MAFNPGITYDSRPLYAGLADGLSSVADAILGRAKQRQEKEQTAKALETLQPLLDQVAPGAGIRLDKDTPKEMLPTIVSLAGQIEQQKREAPLRGLQMENEKLRQRLSMQEIDQAAANAAALRDAAPMLSPDAMNLPDPAEVSTAMSSGAPIPRGSRGADPARAMAAYLSRGGADPRMLSELGALAQAQAKNANRPGPAGSGGVRVVDIPGMGQMAVDVATGQPIPSSNIVRPDRVDKKTDEKALTASEIKEIQALEQAGRDLGSLFNAFEAMGDPDFGGPVGARFRGFFSAGTDPNLSRINNLVTAATPNLARGVFREVGVLTDADVERYRALLPDATDTATQRRVKMKDLQDRLKVSTAETLATLKAAGRDVAGLEEKILSSAKLKSEVSASGETFKDADGTEYPIRIVRGRRGVVKNGSFFPIIQ